MRIPASSFPPPSDRPTKAGTASGPYSSPNRRGVRSVGRSRSPLPHVGPASSALAQLRIQHRAPIHAVRVAELAGSLPRPGSAFDRLTAAGRRYRAKLWQVWHARRPSSATRTRMKLARDAGFEVVQAPTTPDQHEAGRSEAADAANIRVDSVMNMDHGSTRFRRAIRRWWKELAGCACLCTTPNSGDRTPCYWFRRWLTRRLRIARRGAARRRRFASCFLLRRSQNRSRDRRGMEQISAESSGNGRVYQEFQSPWIQAWFDVGNVVLYGYPQDWIRTLGKSIVKVHLKDFKRKKDGYEWVNLGDGRRRLGGRTRGIS